MSASTYESRPRGLIGGRSLAAAARAVTNRLEFATIRRFHLRAILNVVVGVLLGDGRLLLWRRFDAEPFQHFVIVIIVKERKKNKRKKEKSFFFPFGFSSIDTSTQQNKTKFESMFFDF
jgi:hypothetical protein